MQSKFEYMKKDLYDLAETALEQVIALSDCIEAGDLDRAMNIVARDDYLDALEKDIDNLSQTALLEAVATHQRLEEEQAQVLLLDDPLHFALSAIRLTRFFERIGDEVVNSARAYARGKLALDKEEKMNLLMSRVVTSVGMSVESLIEHKVKFFGSIHAVEREIDLISAEIFLELGSRQDIDRKQALDMFRILLSLERIGDLSVNITEELVRLATGHDIRHMDFNTRETILSESRKSQVQNL